MKRSPSCNEGLHIYRNIIDAEWVLKKLSADYEIMVVDERFKNIRG